jgi:hypothetical protein
MQANKVGPATRQLMIGFLRVWGDAGWVRCGVMQRLGLLRSQGVIGRGENRNRIGPIDLRRNVSERGMREKVWCWEGFVLLVNKSKKMLEWMSTTSC